MKYVPVLVFVKYICTIHNHTQIFEHERTRHRSKRFKLPEYMSVTLLFFGQDHREQVSHCWSNSWKTLQSGLGQGHQATKFTFQQSSAFNQVLCLLLVVMDKIDCLVEFFVVRIGKFRGSEIAVKKAILRSRQLQKGLT